MIRKHQFVTYTVRKQVISAIVRVVHRDGTATIEARHILDDESNPSGSYLGFRYRMDISDLSEAASRCNGLTSPG